MTVIATNSTSARPSQRKLRRISPPRRWAGDVRNKGSANELSIGGSSIAGLDTDARWPRQGQGLRKPRGSSEDGAMTDPDPEFPATAARILRGATRLLEGLGYAAIAEIGRASCRERV